MSFLTRLQGYEMRDRQAHDQLVGEELRAICYSGSGSRGGGHSTARGGLRWAKFSVSGSRTSRADAARPLHELVPEPHSEKRPRAGGDEEPARWPEPLRQELAANENGGAAAEHRRRLVGGFRKAREALDAFKPDLVLIWGDDQYENFREDGVPSFLRLCARRRSTVAPVRPPRPRPNHWQRLGREPTQAVRDPGHPCCRLPSRGRS